jgi:hypothetical protein
MNQSALSNVMLPPQIEHLEVGMARRMRFISSAAQSNVTITYTDLLDTVLVAKTATTGSQLFDAVKVKFVEIWSSGATTPTTISVRFGTGTTNPDEVLHSDTSIGNSVPSHLKAFPSQKALASFYNTNSAQAVFTLDCPSGSVIDVHCSFRNRPTNNTNLQQALVAATAGALYFRGLDGDQASVSTLLPAAPLLTIQ